MSIAKIQYFFRALATKTVNELYIAKVAVKIEQILKENNIDMRKCFFVVKGVEDRGPVIFILEKRDWHITIFAEIAVPHKLGENLAMLGHALTTCGITLVERIWITGYGIKHISKDETKRAKINELKQIVSGLRQRLGLS